MIFNCVGGASTIIQMSSALRTTRRKLHSYLRWTSSCHFSRHLSTRVKFSTQVNISLQNIDLKKSFRLPIEYSLLSISQLLKIIIYSKCIFWFCINNLQNVFSGNLNICIFSRNKVSDLLNCNIKISP